MSEQSIHAQTAISYLQDVEQQFQTLEREDNHLIKESMGERIIYGDLSLARKEASAADEHERISLEARCDYDEGRIRWRIAQGYTAFALLDDAKKTMRSHMVQAGESFAKAASKDPDPLYQCSLGLVYATLGRNSEAAQVLQLAANGNNPEVAMEARKALGRLGPITPLAGTPSVVNDNGGVAFIRKKQTDWNAGIKGIAWVALGVGLAATMVLSCLGIPMIGWGAWLIYVGFVKGIDT